MKREELSKGEQKVINMIEKVCIEKGGDGWYSSISDKQKHDVIMTLAKDLLRGLERYEQMA